MNPCNPSPPRNTYVCMYVYVLKTIQVYKYIYSFSACSSEQDPTPLFTNILSDTRRTTRSLSPTTIADERARGEGGGRGGSKEGERRDVGGDRILSSVQLRNSPVNMQLLNSIIAATQAASG